MFFPIFIGFFKVFSIIKLDMTNGLARKKFLIIFVEYFADITVLCCKAFILPTFNKEIYCVFQGKLMNFVKLSLRLFSNLHIMIIIIN